MFLNYTKVQPSVHEPSPSHDDGVELISDKHTVAANVPLTIAVLQTKKISP